MAHRPVYDTAPTSTYKKIRNLDLSADRVAQLGRDGVAAELSAATDELANVILGRVRHAAEELATTFADASALNAATGGPVYANLEDGLRGVVAALIGAGILVERPWPSTKEVAGLLDNVADKVALAGRTFTRKIQLTA